MPEEVDFKKVIAGDDKTYGLDFSNDDGTDKDVSGWTFTMYINQENGRDIEVGQSNVNMNEAASGSITITVPSSQTEKLSERPKPEARITAETASGETKTIIYGDIPVEVIS